MLFNPFTQAPVAVVNYGYGPDFDRPIDPSGYQAPRDSHCPFFNVFEPAPV